MTRLQQLQSTLARDLLEGGDAALPHVAPGGPLTPGQRLEIYRHAYRARLLETLAHDYPALHHVTGDEAFGRLGAAYVNAHPSNRFSLRWFGARLDEFMATTTAFVIPANLVELARFEWAFVETFDAADAPLATAADAACIAPEGWPALRVVLHPTLQRVELGWNTLAVWRAARAGDPVPAPERLAEPLAFAVWRPALTTRYRHLAAREACALDRAAAGAPFADLCEVVATGTHGATAAADAAALLKGWLEEGLVTRLEPGAP